MFSPDISAVSILRTAFATLGDGVPSMIVLNGETTKQDTVISLNNSTVLYADNVLWTTSGSGSFSPDASATNPQYFASTTDIANGSVVLTLTGSQDPGNCGAESSDDILINFIELPTADAGPDATICDDNSYTLGQANATNYSSLPKTYNK